jgi:hypothetical protein
MGKMKYYLTIGLIAAVTMAIIFRVPKAKEIVVGA